MAVQRVRVIDTHTAGEPTRIVLEGAPELPGRTIMEKKNYMMTHREDQFRCSLMHEPRGHKCMFGAIVLPPCDPGADLGLIFMDGSIYDNMCGHGSIGAAMLAVERGLVPVREPVTEIRLDTPSGVVTARVDVKDGLATGVTLQNVPCFVYRQDAVVETEHYGPVQGDVVFGGNFFFLADADHLGLSLSRENAGKLTAFSMELMRCANSQIPVQHPELPIDEITIVELYSRKTVHPEAHQHDFVVAGDGQIDRSPCGTGTCAKMAAMYARGQLKLGEPFVYEGICDTMFTGRILGETRVGDFPAIMPEIRGMAYITAESTILLDDRDPLRDGFVLA